MTRPPVAAPGVVAGRTRSLAGTALPVLLVVGLVLLVPSGRATASEDDDDPAAVAALHRAATALADLGYRGTRIRSVSTADGDEIRIEDVDHPSSAGLVGSAQTLAALTAGYRVVGAGRQRVAGRPATVVQVLDDGRLRAQLWLDDATGLPLREEVYDSTGRVVRLAAFLDIRITATTGGTRPAATLTPGGSPTGAAGVLSASLPAAAGSVCRSAQECPSVLIDRFRLLDSRIVSVPAAQGGDAVHLTYTDGISTLSLFVQHGRLADAVPGTRAATWGGARVLVGRGWPDRVLWQGGDCVFTIVSDAPAETLAAVVDALPHTGGGGGPFDGVTREVQAVLGLLS